MKGGDTDEEETNGQERIAEIQVRAECQNKSGQTIKTSKQEKKIMMTIKQIVTRRVWLKYRYIQVSKIPNWLIDGIKICRIINRRS